MVLDGYILPLKSMEKFWNANNEQEKLETNTDTKSGNWKMDLSLSCLALKV